MSESIGIRIYEAAGVCDALGREFYPGAVAVELEKGRAGVRGEPGGADRILEAGPTEDLKRQLGGDAEVIRLPGMLLLPAMVNAHTHLDLTAAGPRPYGGNFVAWLKAAMQLRPGNAQAVRAAVREGLEMSRRAGVGWVGDVAGSVEAVRAWRSNQAEIGVEGVSYLECFGIGRRQLDGFARLTEQLDELPRPERLRGREVVLGIAPHSPYAVGLPFYNAVGRLAEEREYRLCTHLAESSPELEFVQEGTGPLAELLRELGKWDETIRGTGMHPVEYLEVELWRGGWMAVHCNYVEEQHIRILAACGVSVAYCPVASDYFGQPEWGGHHYRQMIEAGVNVCLGTDSILCQPGEEAQPMGIVAQMRYLYRRDRTDPRLLLAMATVNGLKAMGLKETWASFEPGSPARIVGLRVDEQGEGDLLSQALLRGEPVRPVHWAGAAERAWAGWVG